MKVLLLEDEEITREFFIKILQEIPEVKDVLATSNGEETISLAHSEKPDLILLDIELDGQDIDGLQVARSLFEHNQDNYIVFITGYAKYALESFSVHPYDYILKPVNKNRMIKLIKEIAVKVKNSSFKPLKITYASKMYLIDPNEIIFRGHKSYLINYEHIDTIKINPNRTYQVKFRNYSEMAMMSRQGYKEYKILTS